MDMVPTVPVPVIDLKKYPCRRCGKHVNTRFRFEIKNGKDTWYEHPYCLMVKR